MKYLKIFIIGALFLFSGAVISVYPEENQEGTSEDNSEYEFDGSEFEKKLFTFGGYAEIFSSLYIADRDAALYRLKYYDDEPGNPYADAFLRVQPELTFEKGVFKAFARGYGYAGYSESEWDYDALLYEGYGTLKPNQNIVIDAGKKTMKWGKGYAWNPAAFIDRPKNPDDPEFANEGFVLASADIIVSFDSPLQTISLTPVFLPVYKEINDDFGNSKDWNFAGKLYMLFYDTDIDFIALIGDSRGDRYGMDMSRNLSTTFEIHGECAYIPDFSKRYLDGSGAVEEKKFNAVNALAGVRYLTESETTFIIEYYFNGTGMTAEEMENYYDLIDTAYSAYVNTGNEAPLNKASSMAKGNYGKPNPMKNYLYFRASQKEPFDILYFTPALTSIFNIDDSSFTLTPELIYTGINNLELRARYAWLYGKENTEYGEKISDHRIDLRARYSF